MTITSFPISTVTIDLDQVSQDVVASEAARDAALAAAATLGATPYATKADMDAVTPGTLPAIGYVYADPVDVNNGLYFYPVGGIAWEKDATTYAPIASPNFTGTPTAPTAATGTITTQIATTEFVSAEKAEDASRAITAAFGQFTLARTWLDTGPFVMHSDDQISEWKSVDDSETVIDLHTSIFAGSEMSPRPRKTNKGVFFEQQNGFDIADGVFTSTSDFACYLAFDADPASVVNYATKAIADADVANQNNGTIMRVTDDANTNKSGIDYPLVYGVEWTDAELINGYYIKYNGSWSSLTGYELFGLIGSGSNWLKCTIDKLGRLVFIYQGGPGITYKVSTNYQNVFDVSGPQIIAVRRKGDIMSIWYNGDEVAQLDVSVLADLTTLSAFYLNGDSRSASTTFPVSGTRFYCKAIAFSTGGDVNDFRRAHDAIADHSGTPRIALPAEAWGVLAAGQSWWSGTLGAGAAYVTSGPTPWDGDVDAIGTNADGNNSHPTKEFIPNVRVNASQHENDNIGPLNYFLGYSPASYPSGSNRTGNIIRDPLVANVRSEGNTRGLFKHLTTYAEDTGIPVDWTICSAGREGASLDSLAARTDPPPLVQSLKSKTDSDITFVEELMQSVVYARDYHAARGQVFNVKAMLWQQGRSSTTDADYTTTFLAYYDAINADVKRITGQSNDVIVFFPQPNYATSNTSTVTNTGVNLDQQFLDIVDQRGTRPMYCLGPQYMVTNALHPYVLGHRWLGEQFGKIIKRVLFDGVDWQPLRPRTFTLGATHVDVDFYVPVGSLQFDTNANNIFETIQTGAINTYGFEYTDTSGGGVTITSVSISDADTVRINLSGAPASGDILKYTGDNSRYGNLCDQDGELAFYQDQDWTVAFSGNSPTYALGLSNDLRNWCCAFTKVLE